LEKLFIFLRRHSKDWWYLPLVCLLAFIDLFVVFIPTEGMIILTSIMRPRRWLATGIAVTTASSIGALTIALLTYRYGEPFVAWIAGANFLEAPSWIKTQGWIDQYGFWAVWFIALGPLPQQPAILIGALAGMEPASIFGAVWLGRAPKYLLFSFLATKGEAWIKAEFDNHEGWGNQLWIRDLLLKLVHDPLEEVAETLPPDSEPKP
jgi:membrane protein YqaA with SNARE-associated domain